jgi:hypothetical protein
MIHADIMRESRVRQILYNTTHHRRLLRGGQLIIMSGIKHMETMSLSLPGRFPSLHWDDFPLTLLQGLSHWLTGALPCRP